LNKHHGRNTVETCQYQFCNACDISGEVNIGRNKKYTRRRYAKNLAMGMNLCIDPFCVDTYDHTKWETYAGMIPVNPEITIIANSHP
jgi:hypothetical protein